MARMMTDPDQFYKTMLTALMDMGGFRAGTAMTAVGRQLLGGKMAKPTAEEMQGILACLHAGQVAFRSGTGVFVDKGGLDRRRRPLRIPSAGSWSGRTRFLLPACGG